MMKYACHRRVGCCCLVGVFFCGSHQTGLSADGEAERRCRTSRFEIPRRSGGLWEGLRDVTVVVMN